MLYFLQTAIPEEAHLEKGLMSIYGIGNSSSKLSIKIYGLLEDARGKDLRRLHRLQLRANFESFPRPLGADLKQIYIMNCQRLIDIISYKGRRHKLGYPVRGQRTHTNARIQRRLYKRWIIQEVYENSNLVFNQKKSNSKTKKNQKKK